MKRWIHSSVILCIIAAFGCGVSVERGEVEGQIRMGGKPLSEVVVTFVPDVGAHPNAVRASGVSDARGQFKLRTEDLQDTVLVGSYRVIVEDLSIYNAPRAPDGTVLRQPPTRFPMKYRDPIQTPLERKIQAGKQTVTLDLVGS